MLKDSIKFDPEKTEKLLQDWKEKLENAQKGHYSQCERLGTINTRIGVALILSSTIVTGFIFYSSSKLAKDSDVFTLVYGVLSIIVAAIPGIVSFSRFSDRATEHRITAGNYGKLRRKLESIATISSDEYHTDNFKHKLKTLRIEWEYVASLAPLTPKNFIGHPEKPSQTDKKIPMISECGSILSNPYVSIPAIGIVIFLLLQLLP